MTARTRIDGTRRYRVLGRIAAPSLPVGSLGRDVKIRRVETAEGSGRPTHLKARMNPDFQGGAVSGSPSEVTVHSDALIEMRVRANSREEALSIAQRSHVQPLVASLMMLTGGVAWIELIKVDEEDETGAVMETGWSVWSLSAMAANVGPMLELGDSDISHLERLTKAIQRDKVAARASADLLAATSMGWTAGGREAEASAAVLKFFLVIERVATRVAANRPPEPSDDAHLLRVIAGLRRDLKTESLKQAERVISNAANEIEKGRGRRLKADIAYTCDELSVPQSIREAALSLNNLRNSALAHPGRSLDRHRLASGLSTAEQTSRSIFSAYVRHLAPG